MDQKDIRDVKGNLIHLGSVLKHLDEENVRGVVTYIAKAGDYPPAPAMYVGDFMILLSGSSRVTNQYYKWVTVPREEQTFSERYHSWFYDPDSVDYGEHEYRQLTKKECLAISGIIALLPKDPVDWEWGPWPDSVESALKFVARHLAEQAGEECNLYWVT